MKRKMNWVRLGTMAAVLCAVCVIHVSATAYGTGTVTDGPLRMRSGPDLSGSVIGMADKGASVIVLAAADGGWCYVSCDGTEGYMSAAYLNVTAPVPEGKNAVVTASELNLRAGAETSYEILASARQGAAVTLLSGEENGWYKVCCQGVVGYMSAAYLSTGDHAAAPADLGSGTVNVSALNLRSGPSTDYDRIGILGQGAAVQLLELTGGWYKLSYNGTVGYVSAEYISPFGTASAEAQETGTKAVSLAKSFLGVRYVYGGSTPSGFDCSGFSQYIYRQLGYSINRTASTQLCNGTAVTKGNLLAGDLVFFRAPGGSKPATHVGIYVGDGRFIHASSTGRNVIISDLSSGWYSSIFSDARRIA